MLLEHKVGVISGVGPGIGRSVALAFAREGADLALAARSDKTVQAVANEVELLGRRAICVKTDITVPEDCQRLAREAERAFGRIDLLVNNAGLVNPVASFAGSALNDWRQAMEVNYWGSLALTHAVVPYMRKVGGGRVIMINSEAARRTEVGFGPYTGSKAALLAASRVLAKELGAWGIRVNNVVPSATVPSSGTAELPRFLLGQAEQRGVDPKVVYDEVAATRALGYIPTSDEVAGAVLFFASDLGRAVTGEFLHVNGGSWFE
jgi:NAD(P)-dependent dehydrogenase (short-subunit alcohol dehydrogenase family)